MDFKILPLRRTLRVIIRVIDTSVIAREFSDGGFGQVLKILARLGDFVS